MLLKYRNPYRSNEGFDGFTRNGPPGHGRFAAPVLCTNRGRGNDPIKNPNGGERSCQIDALFWSKLTPFLVQNAFEAF